MATNIQMLIFSEGKSNILRADIIPPFRTNAFVSVKKESNEKLQALRFLIMAHLLSASLGETSVSLEHWQKAKELEKLRKERLRYFILNRIILTMRLKAKNPSGDVQVQPVRHVGSGESMKSERFIKSSSFAEIAKGNSNHRFTPLAEESLEEISKGGVLIPDQEAIEQNMKKLEFAVVGKILGKKMSYSFIHDELKRKWKRFGEFKFLLIGKVSFICIFSSLGAREAVLNGGPWTIAGHMVGLSKWAPDFDPESMNGLFSPIWVRFPNLL
ncbi:hypothetical protein M5K25_001949 [Dendrobium thyrsiflorum]|uniref:DUF4283 domain-containing protein n=1 Tax=Dendrobium thyrsiflorum TaxID=117978 RepID=A0ABD0VT42_DENTH